MGRGFSEQFSTMFYSLYLCYVPYGKTCLFAYQMFSISWKINGRSKRTENVNILWHFGDILRRRTKIPKQSYKIRWKIYLWSIQTLGIRKAEINSKTSSLVIGYLPSLSPLKTILVYSIFQVSSFYASEGCNEKSTKDKTLASSVTLNINHKTTAISPDL